MSIVLLVAEEKHRTARREKEARGDIIDTIIISTMPARDRAGSIPVTEFFRQFSEITKLSPKFSERFEFRDKCESEMLCALLLVLLPGASSLFLTRPVLSRRTSVMVMNDGLSRRRALYSSLAVGGALLIGKSEAAVASEEEDGIFRPAAGSMTGQRVLITGGNVGLGLETAKRLKAAGADVILTARSSAKVDGALETLKAVRFMLVCSLAHAHAH
jgi:hypothetical protein